MHTCHPDIHAPKEKMANNRAGEGLEGHAAPPPPLSYRSSFFWAASWALTTVSIEKKTEGRLSMEHFSRLPWAMDPSNF
jgi:hypothetical protein